MSLARLLPSLRNPVLLLLNLTVLFAFAQWRSAAAEESLVLEQTEVIVDPTGPQWPEVSDGHAKSVDPTYGNFYSEHSWNSPPKVIGPKGFNLTLSVKAGNKTGGGITMGTGVGGSGFAFDPAEAVTWARVSNGAPGSDSNSLTVKVTPTNLSNGSTAELRIGGSWGAGVTYRYRVTVGTAGTGDGDGEGDDNTTIIDDEDRKLAAHLDCPSTITIGEIPPVPCHIVITSWRYSADPVEVMLTDGLDFFGNHSNGIQVAQATGNQDVFTWNFPDPYMWGIMIFACPPTNSTVMNCIGMGTEPGPKIINIQVRQGEDVVALTLEIRAVVPPPGLGRFICGFPVGAETLAKWQETGGEQGFLGCATDGERDAASSIAGVDSRLTTFAGGIIVVHQGGNFSGTAFEVHGSIGALYQSLGGTSSRLGLPVSDEHDITGGRRSTFEFGYIAWDKLTGGAMVMREGNASLTLEPDRNRPGEDFASFPAIGDKFEMCRDACAAEDRCAAYTYVKPGLQGDRAMCWLKSAVPPASANDCCISGIKP